MLFLKGLLGLTCLANKSYPILWKTSNKNNIAVEILICIDLFKMFIFEDVNEMKIFWPTNSSSDQFCIFFCISRSFIQVFFSLTFQWHFYPKPASLSEPRV